MTQVMHTAKQRLHFRTMEHIKKYNVPGPRYTSYPTVPFWNETPTEMNWKETMQESFHFLGDKRGISVYVHLPYCESLCTYCGCNTRITRNHAVELPYIKAVLKEWRMVVHSLGELPLIKELHLGGGTPTFFSPENLQYLLEGIFEHAVPTQNAAFSFEGHPGNTTLRHLEVLAGLGFNRVSYGIQDFDPNVQEAIHRKQTAEEVSRVMEWSRKAGYTSVNFDLVYGLPFQTLSSITATVNEVVRLRPDRIAFYSYAHVPWMKPGQRKFTEMDLPEDQVKRALYEKGRSLLEAAGYVEVGMDHFALPHDELFLSMKNGKLHRNFMGYTTEATHLLVGLGVSAISDSWLAFVQNEKTVERYYERIEQGTLPFFRGHVLTEEDLIIRRHILQLMCQFETSWLQEEEQYETLYMALDRLAPLEEDGLIVIEPYKLRITQKGLPFVRNVCMAFDAHLWRTEPSKTLFSKTV